MSTYHIPVLLEESLQGLSILPNGTYVDVTFGGGGHSKGILSRLGNEGRLFGFDQDADTKKNIPNDKRFCFVWSNFRYISNFMRYHEVDGVDGILADLGVSSHHFDEAERGFSFRFDGKLDMRMNQSATLTAEHILNTYSEEALADIFYYYGELSQARKLAKHIVKERASQPITGIFQFVALLQPLLGRDNKKQLAPIFQALRIEVNGEMNALKELLNGALQVLKPGGRIAVITYHSLEDRLVKNFFKTGNFEGKVEKDFFGKISTPFKLINRQVIIPSNDEIQANPRSRSAKLRIAEKLA
ncbi:MAG: 16S rRNA (cytosine(1402)-N(4))-methyltransferase RsmH [Paludibacteraceae bacterium]|nr:16S rRNA (cytosine(1402)-N(4))-methyltransferase RsmH [Paludibacteraceae bacterium]